MVDLIRFAAGERSEEIADALIRRYGSAERVLSWRSAPLPSLVDGDPVAMQLLDACQAVISHCLESEMDQRDIIDTDGDLIRYLNYSLRFRPTECVRVLHLDIRNQLITDELISEGSVNQAHLHIREVVRRALELGSAAILLVHNHPSGDPTPSRQDITLTKKLAAACRTMDIALHDHIIIAERGYCSLRAEGLV